MSVEPSVSDALLCWYDRSARVLPWRIAPGSGGVADPYRVWLAEIMLQQTTVAAAGPYFERFVARWPDVSALAAAEDGALMAAWAGLGYYARARNLLAAAREIVRRGGFPDSAAGLRGLPGVGDYTAAAVAAIAFGEAAVVIDANVERVASRLFAVAEPLRGAKGILKARLAPLVPAERPGDFAQAMMDLGATVCTPRAPDCGGCPVALHCAAHQSGTPTAFPVKLPKRARPMRYATAWWMQWQEQVALVRRAPRGMLGGMLALPGTDWDGEAGAAGSLPMAGRWRTLGAPVCHSFTHFDLQLTILVGEIAGAIDRLDGEPLIWLPRIDLAAAGLPTLYKKAVAAVLASGAIACFEEA